jgi:hypothetical protein
LGSITPFHEIRKKVNEYLNSLKRSNKSELKETTSDPFFDLILSDVKSDTKFEVMRDSKSPLQDSKIGSSSEAMLSLNAANNSSVNQVVKSEQPTEMYHSASNDSKSNTASQKQDIAQPLFSQGSSSQLSQSSSSPMLASSFPIEQQTTLGFNPKPVAPTTAASTAPYIQQSSSSLNQYNKQAQFSGNSMTSNQQQGSFMNQQRNYTQSGQYSRDNYQQMHQNPRNIGYNNQQRMVVNQMQPHQGQYLSQYQMDQQQQQQQQQQQNVIPFQQTVVGSQYSVNQFGYQNTAMNPVSGVGGYSHQHQHQQHQQHVLNQPIQTHSYDATPYGSSSHLNLGQPQPIVSVIPGIIGSAIQPSQQQQIGASLNPMSNLLNNSAAVVPGVPAQKLKQDINPLAIIPKSVIPILPIIDGIMSEAQFYQYQERLRKEREANSMINTTNKRRYTRSRSRSRSYSHSRSSYSRSHSHSRSFSHSRSRSPPPPAHARSHNNRHPKDDKQTARTKYSSRSRTRTRTRSPALASYSKSSRYYHRDRDHRVGGSKRSRSPKYVSSEFRGGASGTSGGFSYSDSRQMDTRSDRYHPYGLSSKMQMQSNSQRSDYPKSNRNYYSLNEKHSRSRTKSPIKTQLEAPITTMTTSTVSASLLSRIGPNKKSAPTRSYTRSRTRSRSRSRSQTNQMSKYSSPLLHIQKTAETTTSNLISNKTPAAAISEIETTQVSTAETEANLPENSAIQEKKDKKEKKKKHHKRDKSEKKEKSRQNTDG